MKNPNFFTITALSFLILGTMGVTAFADENEMLETPEAVIARFNQTAFAEGAFSVTGIPACNADHRDTWDDRTLSEAIAHAYDASKMRGVWVAYKEKVLTNLWTHLGETFPNWRNSDVISKYKVTDLFTIDDASTLISQNANNSYCEYHQISLRGNTTFIKPTALGVSLLRFTIAKGAGVESSIMALGNALKSIKLVPSQRRVLKSFFEAAKRMYDSIEVERQKLSKGERAKKVTHRDFMGQASLLIAYHRFLQDSFQEAAELSSDFYGTDKTNIMAVQTIGIAVANLIEAYGLESDVASRQIADYGRVLSDLLLYQFAPLVDENKRQKFVRPMIILLGKMTAISEANGDMVARDEVTSLKTAWESQDFSNFMAEWLTTSDLKLNGLILNINSLAYKIGLAANVHIKVFEKEDIDRLKSQKARK